MDMRMTGVMMPIDEPGLVLEIDGFHEFPGDADQEFVVNRIDGVKVY